MRSRNGTPQDPNLERDLAAVDATLGGQPVDADLIELAELVLAIQAERPRPRPDFAAELDARMAAGFPRVKASDSDEAPENESGKAGGPEPPRRPRRTFRVPAFRPRRMSLAFGTAASLLIVVTAVVSSGVFSGENRAERVTAEPGTTEGGGQGAAGSAELKAPASKAEDDSAVGASTPRAAEPSTPVSPRAVLPAPAGGGVLPQVRNRQVDRDAALILATPRDDIEDTADGIIQVTDRYQGFVLRSNISGGDEGRAGATLELRIPSDRLQPALRDLSELAHVRSRTQTTQDITARFVSARSRWGEAVAERRALLRQLARATTPNETASIRARLRLTNRRIAAARSDLRGLRNRVDFSSVSVAIEADDSVKAADSGWTPGDALGDALGILRTTLGILMVSLAVLLPLAALGLVAWFASSSVRRGRRERALDSPQN